MVILRVLNVVISHSIPHVSDFIRDGLVEAGVVHGRGTEMIPH